MSLDAAANLDLARVQFATTSIYHFLFVPITIGLAFLVAILQTMWHRSGNPEQRRLTRFFGTLLLINVAIGVVTGLVQEFEFGMNWSAYSRFVGDVFGAPLAMEGLAAFFLESTFLGLVGLRLGPPAQAGPPGLHLVGRRRLAAVRRLHHGRQLLDAAPGGLHHQLQHRPAAAQQRGRSVHQSGVPVGLHPRPAGLRGHRGPDHAGGVGLAPAPGQLGAGLRGAPRRVSLVVLVPAIMLAMFVGSELGVVEAKYQPMKIAAAEAQWNTCQPCSFSLFQIGGGKDDETPTQILEIPHLLSLLATNHWNGQVEGLNQVNAQYQQQYGPGNYVPNVFIQYWSMRVMAYIAALVLLLALWGGWAVWRRRLERSRWFLRLAPWFAIAPFLMNTAGWFLTENGRQPWIVQGLMKTSAGVSPTVSATWIWITLILFILVYAVFAVLDGVLMVRYGRQEPG